MGSWAAVLGLLTPDPSPLDRDTHCAVVVSSNGLYDPNGPYIDGHNPPAEDSFLSTPVFEKPCIVLSFVNLHVSTRFAIVCHVWPLRSPAGLWPVLQKRHMCDTSQPLKLTTHRLELEQLGIAYNELTRLLVRSKWTTDFDRFHTLMGPATPQPNPQTTAIRSSDGTGTSPFVFWDLLSPLSRACRLVGFTSALGTGRSFVRDS